MIRITAENFAKFKSATPKKKWSRTKVEFVCSFCGKVGTINFGTLKLPFICRKCSNSIAQKQKTCIEKKKNTCRKRYGKDYFTQTLAYTEKSRKTCVSKYGVEFTSQISDHNEKTETTCIKRYGCKHNSQSGEYKEKYKKTCLAKYGVDHPAKSMELSKSRKRKIKFNGLTFDSNTEVEVYKFCKENNIPIKYHPKAFKYTDSLGAEHVYFPDFEINGKLYEVKGSYLWKEGRIYFPYRNNLNENELAKIDARDLAKTECMRANNVTVILSSDIDKLRKILIFK